MAEFIYYFKNNPTVYPNRYIKLKDFFRSNSINPYSFSENGKFIIWKENIGKEFEFKYEDLRGKMKVVKYEKPHIYIQYLDFEPHKISVSCLLSCKLGGYLNLIAIALPNIIPFLKNKEEAYLKTIGLDSKAKFICSSCNHVFEGKIHAICNRFKDSGTVICKTCNDGISTPMKYCMIFLKQLGIEYETEKKFKWSNSKRYDFVFNYENKTHIVEVHGGQHYEESFSKLGGRTLEQEQENDKIKRELALNNGVEVYIEVDCRNTNAQHLKRQFISAFANHGFSCNEVDYEECWRLSLSSLKKRCFEIWDSDKNATTTKIATELGVNYATIGRWLRERPQNEGRAYIGTEEKRKGRIKASCTNRKPVICVCQNNIIKEYESARSCFYEFANTVGINQESQLSKVCLTNKDRINNPKRYEGYAFFYKEDYDKYNYNSDKREVI